MVVSTAPGQVTGPTQRAPTSTKALRDRLEKAERSIQRLQANRNPQSFMVHQLSNAKAMSQASDAQFMKYQKSTGTYVPSYVDTIRNVYGSTFISISPTTGEILIQQGGCGPLIITAPQIQINTLTIFNFTTNFEQQASFNGGITESTGHVTFSGLPTSASGLTTGRLWRSGTTVMIV